MSQKQKTPAKKEDKKKKDSPKDKEKKEEDDEDLNIDELVEERQVVAINYEQGGGE